MLSALVCRPNMGLWVLLTVLLLSHQWDWALTLLQKPYINFITVLFLCTSWLLHRICYVDSDPFSLLTYYYPLLIISKWNHKLAHTIVLLRVIQYLTVFFYLPDECCGRSILNRPLGTVGQALFLFQHCLPVYHHLVFLIPCAIAVAA